MSYWKNTDIAQEFNVSYVTVMAWLEQAKTGGNKLRLEEVNGKTKVIKDDHNQSELQRLSDIAARYKINKDLVEVEPEAKFYDMLTAQQVIEIINSLEINNEIPHKFSYINTGATYWDEFLSGVSESGSYEYYNHEVEMLEEQYSYILRELSDYTTINVIDLGPGNGYPVKNLLTFLNKKKKLGKYVAVDISKEMLELAKSNAQEWFPSLPIETYPLDIENQSLLDVFYKDKGHKVCNLVVFLGGTYGALDNRRKALENLRTSMGADDYLIFTNKLDKQTNRVELAHVKEGYQLFLWLPELLNLDVEESEMVTRYNETKLRRQAALKLDKNYAITFDILGTKRRVLLRKGTELVLWFHHMSTMPELISEIDDVGLDLLHISSHTKTSTLLSICKLRV